MKNNLGIAELVTDLESEQSSSFVSLVAVYPRIGDTGLLAEQGALIATIGQSTAMAFPRCKTYRVLWNQLATIVPVVSPEIAVSIWGKILRDTRDGTVEARFVASSVGDREDRISLLDDLLEEISSRRNFGKSDRHPLWRFVDGSSWP